MPVTRTSTTSVATSSTVTTTSDAGSMTQTDTQVTTVTVSTGAVDDLDGLQLALGGEANAIGEDTLAMGSISSLVDGSGGSILAEGSATFDAAAQSSGGGIAFASAGSFADVAGANIVVGATSTSSHTLEVDGQTYWTESSSTSIVALDIEFTTPDWDSDAADAVLPESTSSPSITEEEEYASAPEAAIWPDMIEGNLAFLFIDAEAFGDDVFIGVDASALTLEDQLSTVTALVVTEIA